MPSDPNDCRERARQCAGLADEVEDPKLERTFLELARAWTEMVTKIEMHSRARTDDLPGWQKRFRIELYWVKAAEAEENSRQAASEELRALYYKAAVSWAELAKACRGTGGQYQRSPVGSPDEAPNSIVMPALVAGERPQPRGIYVLLPTKRKDVDGRDDLAAVATRPAMTTSLTTTAGPSPFP